MPYLVEDRIDEAEIAPGDGPVLIVIHGTGASRAARLKPGTNSAWWQSGSEFDRWLCARIRHPTGIKLDSDDILRFVWSGWNSEDARDDAAVALLELVQPLEAAGRPISIVAHGQGGDVARRACEMAAIIGSSAPPWSVVCIGTLFFHYGLAPGLRAIAMLLAILLFCWPFFALAPEWMAVHSLKADEGWYALLIVLLALSALRRVPFALRKLDVRRYRARARFADRGTFTNFWSPHDEALALLRSLNTPVRLMRKTREFPPRPQNERGVWLTVALGTILGGLILKDTVLTVIYLFGSLAGMASFATAARTAAGLLFLVPLAIAVSLFYRLADFPLDLVITRRMRALAYGNPDHAAAITDVELFPWQNEDAAAVPLPREIEEMLEACVAAHAGSPDAPRQALFVSKDIPAFVDRTATNEGFAHSLYFRIEPVADLVAESLVKSGQWQRTRSRATRSALSPSRRSEEDGN